MNRSNIEVLAHDIIKACEYLEEHGGTATPPKLHEHMAYKVGQKA